MKPLAVSIYYFYKVKKKISTALDHFPTTGTNMGDCLIQNNVHGNGFRRPGLTSNKIKSKVCSSFLLRKCFHQGLVLASKLSDEKANTQRGFVQRLQITRVQLQIFISSEIGLQYCEQLSFSATFHLQASKQLHFLRIVRIHFDINIQQIIVGNICIGIRY